jgi:hypothetical protein
MAFPQEQIEDPELSDTDVDNLYDSIYEKKDGPTIIDDPVEGGEQGNGQTPPTPQAQPQTTPPVQAQTPPTTEAEHAFTWNGREIKAPLSQILKWASQGYDYPQKMAEINKLKEQLTPLEQQYKPIDEWVKNNPDKWEKLQAVIHAEKEGITDLPPNHPLLQKLSKFESFMTQMEQEKEIAEQKAWDQKLDQEIQSIQEKYKDLDWKTVDQEGRNRVQNVLLHANQNGHRSFKSAFLDLYHEDLVKSAETKALEQFNANKERQSKAGLLATKQAPTKGALSNYYDKNKSYEALAREALDELGII